MVTCPYCQERALLVGGYDVYPHRPDLHPKMFWQCKPCRAYVGCHPGTTKPMGRLANAELRQWKLRAHASFDPIWRSGKKNRSSAYAWLSRELGLPRAETHIGMFDVETCKRVVEACK
jgi:hypothetical protein